MNRVRELLEHYAAIGERMDNAFRVPGTNWRFGLDPLLGLVPGLGDLVAALVGAYGVLVARRMGAPLAIQGRMLANVCIDAIVGAVPVLGNVFDFAFKSHVRNLALLRRWADDPLRVERSTWIMLIAVPLALLLTAVAVFAVVAASIAWIIGRVAA